MTTSANREEASKISLVFHASLIQLGFEATVDSLDLWEDVQVAPAKATASVGRFLARVLSMIGVRRTQARQLAKSYLRLHRALLTGYAAGPLPQGVQANLRALREDFYTQVERVTPGLLEADRSLVDADGVEVASPPSTSNSPVYVEDLESPDEDEMDEQAEEEVDAQVTNSALRSLEKNSPKDDVPAKEADAQREEAHKTAGSIAAGASQRAVMDAGRDQLAKVIPLDKRAIGYVRVSGTGTPCGWCAALISRGPVYKTKASAGDREDGTKWHPNCNCYVEPVYSQEQYDSDPRFDLNRELSNDWARETRGYRGKAAMSAFRKFVRGKYKDAPGGQSAIAA